MRHRMIVSFCLLVVLGGWGLGRPLLAQGAATVPSDWKGSFGAGLALTGGNTDTSNFNIGFDFVRDPKTRNVFKFKGLFLRGDSDNTRIAEKLRLGLRDEYTISKRTFVFGTVDYLRDPFKQIDYLVNPRAGLGYRFYETDRASFVLDGGAGVVREKNPLTEVETSGSVNAGQSFTYKLSEGTAFNQVLTGLWEMDDLGDSLYQFVIGVATSLTSHSELKVEFVDDYKNAPSAAGVRKNDTAFVTTFLFKF